MILFVNSKNEIKDVGTTKDTSLTHIEVDDNENPFSDWTIAKICCYRIETAEVPIYPDSDEEDPEPIGTKTVITMMTPYVDSRLIEHIDQLGRENSQNSADIDYLAIMVDVDIPR